MKNFKRIENVKYKNNLFEIYINRNDSVYDIIQNGSRNIDLLNKIKGNPFEIALSKIIGELEVQELLA